MNLIYSRINIFILGNGFDLNLGLKSSIYDFIVAKFFKNKREYFNEMFKRYEKNEHDPIFLFLSLVFHDKKFINHDEFLQKFHENYFIFAYIWVNFGNFIKNKCQNFDNWTWSNAESFLKEIVKVRRIFADYNYGGQVELNSSLKNSINHWRDNSSQNVSCFNVTINGYDEIINLLGKLLNSQNKFLSFLDEAVTFFEKDFNDYLIKIIDEKDSNNEIFNYKLQKYLACLFYHFSSLSQSKTFYCLSFNYTKPDHVEIDEIIKQKYPGLHLNIFCHNIHGSIKKDCNSESPPIIFGIDDSENISGSTEFIKSYKIAKLRSKIGPNNYMVLPACECDILNIYFYGHSLSKNDYSYFQAIFDKFNLYSNKVILHFVYPCDPNSMNSSNYCNFEDIYNLIHMYGKSLDNEAKGNNLFSKLLLEDRLKIHFINWSELLRKLNKTNI